MMTSFNRAEKMSSRGGDCLARHGFPSVTTDDGNDASIPNAERLWSYATREKRWKLHRDPRREEESRLLVVEVCDPNACHIHVHRLHVQIDILSLLGEDHTLACEILADPCVLFAACDGRRAFAFAGQVRHGLRAFLCELQLVSIEDRVWLRLVSVGLDLSIAQERKRSGLCCVGSLSVIVGRGGALFAAQRSRKADSGSCVRHRF